MYTKKYAASNFDAWMRDDEMRGELSTRAYRTGSVFYLIPDFGRKQKIFELEQKPRTFFCWCVHQQKLFRVGNFSPMGEGYHDF